MSRIVALCGQTTAEPVLNSTHGNAEMTAVQNVNATWTAALLAMQDYRKRDETAGASKL